MTAALRLRMGNDMILQQEINKREEGTRCPEKKQIHGLFPGKISNQMKMRENPRESAIRTSVPAVPAEHVPSCVQHIQLHI